MTVDPLQPPRSGMRLRWKVAELVSARGWTPQKFGFAAELYPESYRRILSGEAAQVNLETLAKIANALQVEIGDLFEWVEG